MISKHHRSSDAIFKEALRDLQLAVENWRLPLLLAWREIQNRYRRSLLGPLWMTLTLAIRIAALALIFSTLTQRSINVYVPWLTAGIVVWDFISGSLGASGTWFSARAGYITQGHTTLGSLVIWGMMSQILMLFHTLPLCFIVTLVTERGFNANLLFLPLGFLMLCAVLVPMGTILGMLAPRLRDLGPLMDSVLQVIFFLTPIMWLPEAQGITSVVATWNPFSHLIGWMRKPILGKPLDSTDFLLFLGLLFLLAPLALFTFVRYRRRLAYWL